MKNIKKIEIFVSIFVLSLLGYLIYSLIHMALNSKPFDFFKDCLNILIYLIGMMGIMAILDQCDTLRLESLKTKSFLIITYSLVFLVLFTITLHVFMKGIKDAKTGIDIVKVIITYSIIYSMFYKLNEKIRYKLRELKKDFTFKRIKEFEEEQD